jgi:hypothetical protein
MPMKETPFFQCVALALAEVFALAGCDADDTEAFDAADDDTELRGYALTTSIWDTLTIPVCWEDFSDSTSQQRGWVRDAVAESWGANSDVVFVGWGECHTGSPGVRIAVADDQIGPRVEALGNELDGLPQGMWVNFTYYNWAPACQNDPESCTKATAAHQFGHVLGFADEQNRPDTPDNCVPPQGEDGNLLVGGWDAESVMNYCHWDGEGRLSNTDIEMVQLLYGPGLHQRNDYIEYGHGENLWENDWWATVGGPCSDGYTRHDFSFEHEGNGDCWESESFWLDPFNVHDCRVRVNGYNAAGFFNGVCKITIQEKKEGGSTHWEVSPGVCRDDAGGYPSWSDLQWVSEERCLEACRNEVECQGAAYDAANNYCQIFGVFGTNAGSNADAVVTTGNMSQPNFTCHINRGFQRNISPGVCRDDAGNYPRWSRLYGVDLEDCLQACDAEPSCQGTAYKDSQHRCSIYGDFGANAGTDPDAIVTGGAMLNAGYVCQAGVADFCGVYDGRTIALRTAHDRYMMARGSLTGYDISQQTYIGGWEQFDVECVGDKVGLHTFHGRYVMPRSASTGYDVRQQTYLGYWELMTPVRNGDGTWSFRTHTGRYLSASDWYPRLIGQQPHNLAWEHFVVIPQ